MMGIKSVRLGYAEGGSVEPLDATMENMPRITMAPPLGGPPPMVGAPPGLAGAIPPNAPNLFMGYAEGSRENPFASLRGLPFPQYTPYAPTGGTSYYPAAGTTEYVAASVAPTTQEMSPEQKIATIKDILAVLAPNITMTQTGPTVTAQGGAGGTATAAGGAGGTATTGAIDVAAQGGAGGTGGAATTGPASTAAGGASPTGGTSGGTPGTTQTTDTAGNTTTTTTTPGGSTSTTTNPLGDVINSSTTTTTPQGTQTTNNLTGETTTSGGGQAATGGQSTATGGLGAQEAGTPSTSTGAGLAGALESQPQTTGGTQSAQTTPGFEAVAPSATPGAAQGLANALDAIGGEVPSTAGDPTAAAAATALGNALGVDPSNFMGNTTVSQSYDPVTGETRVDIQNATTGQTHSFSTDESGIVPNSFSTTTPGLGGSPATPGAREGAGGELPSAFEGESDRPLNIEITRGRDELSQAPTLSDDIISGGSVFGDTLGELAAAGEVAKEAPATPTTTALDTRGREVTSYSIPNPSVSTQPRTTDTAIPPPGVFEGISKAVNEGISLQDAMTALETGNRSVYDPALGKSVEMSPQDMAAVSLEAGREQSDISKSKGALALEGLTRALASGFTAPIGFSGFANFLGSMLRGGQPALLGQTILGPPSVALQKEMSSYTAGLANQYAGSVMEGSMTAGQAATAAANDPNTAGRLGDVLAAIDNAAERVAAGRASFAERQAAAIEAAREANREALGLDPRDASPAPSGGPSYAPGSVTSEPLSAPPGALDLSQPPTQDISGDMGGGMGYSPGDQAAAEAGGYGGSGMYAHGGSINMRDVIDYLKREYAKGGYVPGSSGGMDDDVPAVIDGNRPARLSSGEFVFDAATVAALGDGNNEAGAKKLNQLREAIRQKAYGHKKQPPKNYSLGDLVGMT